LGGAFLPQLFLLLTFFPTSVRHVAAHIFVSLSCPLPLGNDAGAPGPAVDPAPAADKNFLTFHTFPEREWLNVRYDAEDRL